MYFLPPSPLRGPLPHGGGEFLVSTQCKDSAPYGEVYRGSAKAETERRGYSGCFVLLNGWHCTPYLVPRSLGEVGYPPRRVAPLPHRGRIFTLEPMCKDSAHGGDNKNKLLMAFFFDTIEFIIATKDILWLSKFVILRCV